jgi:hypothetical protein
MDRDISLFVTIYRAFIRVPQWFLCSADIIVSTQIIFSLSNKSMAITALYFGCMGLRLKRGLLCIPMSLP